jgi:hypothetical protein
VSAATSSQTPWRRPRSPRRSSVIHRDGDVTAAGQIRSETRAELADVSEPGLVEQDRIATRGKHGCALPGRRSRQLHTGQRARRRGRVVLDGEHRESLLPNRSWRRRHPPDARLRKEPRSIPVAAALRCARPVFRHVRARGCLGGWGAAHRGGVFGCGRLLLLWCSEREPAAGTTERVPVAGGRR